MRAVVCQGGRLEVAERPAPALGRGQVRLRVLRCGICGSDLHARHGIDHWADLATRAGYHRFGRSDQAVVFGHEFSGEVLEHGPGCAGDVPAGATAVALPLIRNGEGGVDPVGLSAHAPGAYADEVVVQESMMLGAPNGLAPDVAALTEPMAVALHAVRRGEVGRRQVAIVIGCGPVGLGVILVLKARGARTVVAADLSPGRRALASACGADVVVDPGVASPYTAVDGEHVADMPAALELAVGTREKLGRVPGGWWRAWRVAEALGVEPKRPVIFECVGVPGVIDGIVDGAPLFSRVVVVGVCVGPDRFTPAMAINKELELRFVIGYTPLEFRDALRLLAEGQVDPRPMMTGEVGLAGVGAAFDALADPDRHAKVLIDPRRAEARL